MSVFISCIIDGQSNYVVMLNSVITLSRENTYSFESTDYALETAALLNNVYPIQHNIKIESIMIKPTV